MEEEKFVKDRRDIRGTNEGGWKPGVGPLLGVVLSLLLLIASIVLGVTTGLGLIFAVPLGLIAIIVGFLFLRGRASPDMIAAACPNCGATVRAPSHISEVACPACGKQVDVRAVGLSRGV